MRGNSTISNRCRCHRTAAVDHRTSCRWRPPYADATPETVITIGICSVLPSSVYILFAFSSWLQKRKLEKLRQKENAYREEIARLEQEISDRKTVFHLIQLINRCGCETVYFENHRELSDMNRITNDINMKKAQLKDISSQIMVGRNSI